MAFEGLTEKISATFKKLRGKGRLKEADVKEMWLTHYSPSLTRPEEYMDEVRKIFPRAVAGKDRKSVELDFEDEEK